MNNYTSIDTIFSKFYRDIKDSDISETDIVEWAGEALDFMSVYETQEQAVAFIEVKNYTAEMPDGIKYLTQIARDNNFSCPVETETTTGCPNDVITACTNPLEEPAPMEPVPIACDGRPLTDYDLAYYRPYFDLQWEHSFFYKTGYYKNNYTPVRLSNNTLFKNFVCEETETEHYGEDEYTIIGTTQKQFRLSFKEGRILVSYLRTAIDKENGYPLIPENVSVNNAILYYIKWKIAEMEMWNHKEGSVAQVQYNNKQWLKYCKQAKNYFKMPKTIDDHQNLLEESYQLIPRHKRYYGFFGNMGRAENKKFNDPDHRTKNYYN